ncbi:MAG: hypothetical protein E7527_06575 [Ruminococcaceae bacterium]|nr:hypothetical protein [Oscillospiraceae bacterium]
MERKTLNQQGIRRFVLGDEMAKGMKAQTFAMWCGILFLLIAALCAIAGYTAPSESAYVVAGIFGGIGVLALVLLWYAGKQRRAIDRLHYVVRCKTCTGKYQTTYTGEGVDGSEEILCFGKSEVKMHFPFASMGYSVSLLYEQATVGDKFYLVYLKESKKPLLLFNTKEWKLDKEEFEKTEQGYVPKKV